ncbi:hypothetical protein [Scatolibacter rhodanostii]|uniref:hypothetical protein n=1 Tax=Scatolibacter rhodanostii TaxID=2014781 RepID=UPI000C0825C7|nr:hypothetical protein [Scatolibacter rhodanostii]
MKNINWNDVEEAKEFSRLPVGGYICGIVRVEDFPDKEYLRIEYDIADGEFKNYYREQQQKFPDWNWGGVLIRSYKEKAQPFFKAFLTSVEKSNSGYKFGNDENTLSRKMVGLVLGEEEYSKSKGGIGTRLYVAEVHSTQAIKDGKFEIPKLKTLSGSAAPATTNSSGFQEIDGLSDEDLPF